MADVVTSLVVLITIVLLVVFLLECMSTDIISTIVYAIPYIIIAIFILTNSSYFMEPIKGVLYVFLVVITLVIMTNILKVVVWS